MKHSIITPLNILFILFCLVTSCSKKDVLNQAPIPTPPGDTTSAIKGSFRFQPTVDLTGLPYHNSNLHAVVSIAKQNGEEVIKDQILNLDLSTVVKTATIELPEGDYQLTGFRMVYGSVATHYASPFAGSAKASSVQKPLKLNFKVVRNVVTETAVEVLRITEGDKPQQYGYPSGAFDNGQADASPFLKIKLKAIMQIGDVRYDSIPASLAITTWNDKGEMSTTYGALAAGENQVQLLKAATRYELRVSKWGTTDAITINRQDVDENHLYVLGGSKEARKLASERVLKIIDGRDVADTKTDYFYDHEGNLLKIDYWKKKPDNTNLLFMVDLFTYNGTQLAKVKRVNVDNNTVLKETVFGYNAQGKLTNIRELVNGQQTNADINYLPSAQSIGIIYHLPSGHTMNYSMQFYNGNLLSSTTSNSNGSYEQGRYSYDFGINPYRHMNLPSMFLSNSSINNVTSQQKEYTGAYPAVDAYSFVYKYDANGYPIEVIKNYRSFPSGNFAYSTKTVFVYQ